MVHTFSLKMDKRKTLFMCVIIHEQGLLVKPTKTVDFGLDLDGFFHCFAKCLGSGCLGTGKLETSG